MIKPTIGRVVLYKAVERDQPWPALVSYVYSDRCINLGGFTHLGEPFARTSVTLCQDAKEPSTGQAFWMPYQKEAAAKAEAAKV